MTNVRMKNVSTYQIRTEGLQALEEKLGIVGAIRFLQQFDNGGNGDYTREKYDKEDVELTEEEMCRIFG